MSRWGCPACGTVYGQLLYAGCPRCPGTKLEEQMPKITVHGGASNADDPRPVDTGEGFQPAGDDLDGVVGEHGAELVDLPPGSYVYSHGDSLQVEEVPPSAGTSSSTSAAKPRKNTATRKSGSPSPAPTTENP